MFSKMSNDLSRSGVSQAEREAKETMEDFKTEERRFKEVIGVISDLSDAIKDLAVATASQKQPIVVNLIATNDDDLKKFATIFAQGIK